MTINTANGHLAHGAQQAEALYVMTHPHESAEIAASLQSQKQLEQEQQSSSLPPTEVKPEKALLPLETSEYLSR